MRPVHEQGLEPEQGNAPENEQAMRPWQQGNAPENEQAMRPWQQGNRPESNVFCMSANPHSGAPGGAMRCEAKRALFAQLPESRARQQQQSASDRLPALIWFDSCSCGTMLYSNLKLRAAPSASPSLPPLPFPPPKISR